MLDYIFALREAVTLQNNVTSQRMVTIQIAVG